ncbi:MAG TPA: DUF6325 family protein [Ilumatobacter sp.]|jgi:hypothetical protein|nr:DUF6325 family protein [Ilumatobacter sp.]
MSDSRTAEQLGPVELIALAFHQPKFDGSVLRELVDLVERNVIRVLDLMVVHKTNDGSIEVAEFSDLGDEAELFIGLAPAGVDLIGDDDVSLAGELLEPGDAAALLVWEDVWAAPFAAAVKKAGGVLLAHDRIPVDVLEAVMSYEGDES